MAASLSARNRLAAGRQLELPMKILTDILTGKDNSTFDIARVAGALTVITYLGLSVYSVAKDQAHHFDMQAFGIGAGAVIAAMGAALGMKAKSEPGS